MTGTASTQLAEILAGVDDRPASYLAAAHRLAALEDRGGLQPVRVFALATFTFELMAPYLAVECARRGMDATIASGPFGQLEQQALAATSELYAFAPDVVVIAARVEEVAPALADGFLASGADASNAAIDEYLERLVALARAIRANSRATVLVWNQPPLQRLVAGLADVALATPQQHAIGELGHRLARACATIAGVHVFDVARVATELGTQRWFDRKLHALARMPLSAAAQIAVARRTARVLRSLRKSPAKCLVLDLDNTLWGGVLGEDGLGGIALGDDGRGSIYKAFQRALRGYLDRGVLLAIASKNNEADVAELFAGHRDMVLGRDDFAATQIHWNDKTSSLRAIAAQLDIGVDSLVFFDDNPRERAWVREQLPAVTVIDVPDDPLRFIDALDDAGAFDHLVVTAEDRARAEQYRHEHQRKQLAGTATSVDEFLRALEIQVIIGTIATADVPRVVQLLAKTNQFNVTTRRHGEPELAALLARDGAIGLWMRVADRYGDSGLVAVALAVLEDDGYRLDSFLMSCRVLGRRVEHALMWSLVRRARARARVLRGELIPTKKNMPAAGFFADVGFEPGDRANAWRLDLERGIERPSACEIVEES